MIHRLTPICENAKGDTGRRSQLSTNFYFDSDSLGGENQCQTAACIADSAKIRPESENIFPSQIMHAAKQQLDNFPIRLVGAVRE